MSTTIMQSLTFLIFIMFQKIVALKFLLHADNRPTSQPNTDHYLDLHFQCKSKMRYTHINLLIQYIYQQTKISTHKQILMKPIPNIFYLDISSSLLADSCLNPHPPIQLSSTFQQRTEFIFSHLSLENQAWKGMFNVMKVTAECQQR